MECGERERTLDLSQEPVGEKWALTESEGLRRRGSGASDAWEATRSGSLGALERGLARRWKFGSWRVKEFGGPDARPREWSTCLRTGLRQQEMRDTQERGVLEASSVSAEEGRRMENGDHTPSSGLGSLHHVCTEPLMNASGRPFSPLLHR